MHIYTKEEAKKEIGSLTQSFDQKIDFYKSDKYKEANLEDDYLKPLLRFLNWNTSNEGIQNLANREVIVQAKGKHGKEPDYLLQLDTKPHFYIEAKHPKYKLFSEIKYIWQAYAYAYSTQSSSDRKKVDFSLLTDFEEFRFFDCTFKADKSTVQNFVVLDWKYEDYVDKFDDLWDLFEKEQVRAGSLKSLYLNEKKIKQNRIPPDKAFLADLDDEKKGWRIRLAKDIKKYNPELTSEYITRAVQIILDRFIFIKVLSDREIEDDYLAQVIENIDKAALKSEKGILDESCKDIFARLNQVYNGSIFAPRPEVQNISLSNKTLHSVLKEFLPENSRYNFKQIPVEVLGTIYEQFLGKVIHATDKRVKVEYKPEVRKAGGVYYTPQYIVSYIVENTVGEKLKSCRSIDDVFALKICDPACGSGSFLLGAFDKLIHWCIEFYTKKIKPGAKLTKKQQEHIYVDADNQVRITSKLKRDLLRFCIFGVDIDQQAVEVAITSLSLKALEDTRHDELYQEVNLFQQSVLPNLDENIKCGNSLIGMDIYDGKLDFSHEEERKLNPFDWHSEFADIFKNGGFDCVIGNPPYGRYTGLTDNVKKYLKKKGYYGKTSDLAEFFINKVDEILKNEAYFSFIVPKGLTYVKSWKSIRTKLTSNYIPRIFVDASKAFKDAKYEMVIFNTQKANDGKSNNLKVGQIQNEQVQITETTTACVNANIILTISEKKVLNLYDKIKSTTKPVSNYYNFWYGKGGLTPSVNKNNNGIQLLTGKEINRYFTNKKEIWHIENKFLTTADIKKNSVPKVVVQDIVAHIKNPQPHIKLTANLDENNLFCLNTVMCFSEKTNLKNQFLLGIINSKLMSFYYYKFVFNQAIRTMHFMPGYSDILPIPLEHIIDSYHDSVVEMVDKILHEHNVLQLGTTDQEKIQSQRKIDYIDKQIDEVVYELYGLTPEEIAIVKGKI